MPDSRPPLIQDSIAEPVYGFINELFVLKGVFKWFRRQLIYFIKLTYGGTVNGTWIPGTFPAISVVVSDVRVRVSTPSTCPPP